MKDFEQAYSALNPAQKEAVDTLEGPVLVVAGPGTGKTQVLSIRIANILKKTQSGSDGVLALTFTRAGVRAMRERLESYIGEEAKKVIISTFHSFCEEIVSNHYKIIDIDKKPELLKDDEAVLLIDEILHSGNYEYLKPRSNPGQYFFDLKSLISILKREQLSSFDFMSKIDREIKGLKTDPDSISSRGPSKGQIKKEIEKKIESLERTREVVEFYEEYESKKRDNNYMDYDDVLSYATNIIQTSEDVRDEIRENYLYVLVDEHQDSSGIQNSFLKAVWQGVDSPNIFVVGDDRQLIYGFSGASLSYFEEFKNVFGKAEVITLTENYRSTKTILSVADSLQKSSMASGDLLSNTKKDGPVLLQEYSYPRDEYLGALYYFKQKIESGVSENELALLLPKNKDVRIASEIFKNAGIPVRTESKANLFSMHEYKEFRKILNVLNEPMEGVNISLALLGDLSMVSKFGAHKFLYPFRGKDITLESLLISAKKSLFENDEEKISVFGGRLKEYLDKKGDIDLSSFVIEVGREFLLKNIKDNDILVRRIEALRSLVHLADNLVQRNENVYLSDFLSYIDRLESYGQGVPVAVFSSGSGVTIQTLHASKGLEYEYVFVAHLNEETMLSHKRLPFTLPASIEEKIEARDEAVARRELYVAITRAKTECVLSYGFQTNENRELTKLNMLSEIPDNFLKVSKKDETEKEILSHGDLSYFPLDKTLLDKDILSGVKNFVQEEYDTKNVTVTLLNNFFSCPWKWYFRNFLQLPDKKTISLYLGTVVHDAIDYVLKKDGEVTESEIKKVIKNKIEKEGVAEKRQRVDIEKTALKILGRFIDRWKDKIAKKHSTEKSLSFNDKRFPHLKMYGKIDLVETDEEGRIIVTDFKTGTPKTSSQIEKTRDDGRLSDLLRQLSMYSYLVSGANKEDVYLTRLLFLEAEGKNEKDEVYEKFIGESHVDDLISDISFYDQKVKSGEWMDLPCENDGFGREKKDCEYCKMKNEIFKN